jgi:transposase
MALATEVFLGDPSRFARGNQVASYIGMIPCEHSSGKRQRLGKMTKEGNSLLRYLWTEATLHAVGKEPELKRLYRRKLIQKGMGNARIAVARKLGLRLWARSDRLRRVLPPRQIAAERGSPCGDARFQQWSCIAVTGFTE